MRWKTQSQSVLHEETDTCEDLLLKVKNIYITNALIISVHFDIPLINFKLLWTSVKMIPEKKPCNPNPYSTKH
jgi:hypothetical protein